jgi:hypothetical protein
MEQSKEAGVSEWRSGANEARFTGHGSAEMVEANARSVATE